MRRGAKYFLLILLGVGIGITIIIVFSVSILLSFVKTDISTQKNSYLILDFGGDIKEKPISEYNYLLSGNRAKEMELIKYLKSIEYATYDNNIDGIIINGDFTYYSRAYVEEIREVINRFKKSGKPVYAWLSSGSNTNYSLCLSADKIYMPNTESASLSLKGYSTSIPYIKKGLSQLGVETEVIHIGDYKGSYENYSKENMSLELKNSYLSIFESLHNEFLSSISNYRNIDIENLKFIFSENKTLMMSPNVAKELGFIDDFYSYDELKRTTSQTFNEVSIYNYSMNLKKKMTNNKIAVIYAEGTISNYFTSSDRMFGDIIGAKSIIRDINTIKKDKNVKSVILRVNSPGGSALASELILRELIELKKHKPLYISFGPIAASGGYYISALGDRIFNSPSTITGSIGVVSVLFNHKELSDKLGINFETIKKYEYDDIFTSTRKAYQYEIDIMRKSMIGIYDEFTDHVSEGRNIDKKELEKIAQGRIWSGIQAVENKLSDEIGGLINTIEYAVTTNNIKSYTIDSYPKAPGFWSSIQNPNTFYKDTFIDIFTDFNKIKELLLYYRENKNNPGCYEPYIGDYR